MPKAPAQAPEKLPVLNWKELARLIEQISPELPGLYADRVVVPDRARFTGGYLKGEWAIRLTGRRSEGTLLFSIRARSPYVAWIPGKGPRAATAATRSAFDLALGKFIRERRLLGMESLDRERTVILWFSGEESEQDRLGLVLNLIPASPEALLVRGGAPAPWPILARTRALQPGDKGYALTFTPPDGAQAPASPEVRAELVASPAAYLRAVEGALESEAFELRAHAVGRALRERLKQARERLRQSETAEQEASREADWQRYGDLLKAVLGNPPPIEAAEGKNAWKRRVQDYATEEWMDVPADPKLGPGEQVEKFYQLSRRKQRRLEEARSRAAGFREEIARVEKLAEAPLAHRDWPALERLERAAGFATSAASRAEGAPGKGAAKKGAWLGKTFTSRDGLTIWVGRSKDENLELTFKHARGNDLWLHVRGRPGAHVVIPIQPGKSAPLETLLDAATLAVYYSGGESWGKTEVDYTFKKHVKRIKDSTEASYVQNKTLIVEPDRERIKRLLGT